MNQLEKHQKAIKVLNAIEECEKRIDSHSSSIGQKNQPNIKWHTERFFTNMKVQLRLKDYYNNNFKI